MYFKMFVSLIEFWMIGCMFLWIYKDWTQPQTYEGDRVRLHYSTLLIIALILHNMLTIDQPRHWFDNKPKVVCDFKMNKSGTYTCDENGVVSFSEK